VSTDPAAAAAVAQDPAASGTAAVAQDPAASDTAAVAQDPAASDTAAVAQDPAASDTSVVPATEVPDAAPEVSVRVVSGSPTPHELAAVVAVLLAVTDGVCESRASEVPTPATSTWSAPALRLRTAYGRGRGGWRTSALPR